jgi:GNAT superfamily N-acetyltransferase
MEPICERLTIIGMDGLVANTRHLQQIVDLYTSYYNQSFRVTPELFHSTILSLPNTQWMLAVFDTFDGRIIGIVNAHVEHTFLHGGKYICVVDDFIVDAEYRRKGIGKWILEHLENYARRHSCRVLRFHIRYPSDSSQHFFKKYDYTVIHDGLVERNVGFSGN